MRGYIAAMAGGLIIGIAIIPVLMALEPDLTGTMLFLGATGLLAVAADYSFWRWVGFEAVANEDVPVADAGEPQREPLSGR